MVTKDHGKIRRNKYRQAYVNFKQTDYVCIKFIESQGNYANAIRYLIMKEVKENGFRNLNNILPAELTDNYFNFDFKSIIPDNDIGLCKNSGEVEHEQIESCNVYDNSTESMTLNNKVNNEFDDFDLFDDDERYEAEIIKGVIINADK